MKTFLKLSLALVLIFLGLFTWHSRSLEKKNYLKQETYYRHLDKKTQNTFLSKSLPLWMEEQLKEDFREFEKSGISKAQVDATFDQIQKTFPTEFIIRYRILNNELYRYFREGEQITLKDTSTELAIKTLLECTPLPDIDCIISFFDGIRPNHTFFHTESKTQQAPLLISAKIKDTPLVVLIPDFRSIGHWWISDIKHVKSKMKSFPWEEKKDLAIWRGTYNRKERLALCKLSSLHPDILDAKFNLPLDNPEIEEYMGEFISWENLLECKYHPYVDGYVTAAPALQWRLLSNCVCFKPDTDDIQWFHRALEPYVHFIPVKRDFSNLIETLEWAKNHDVQCKKIAETATEFALNNLMYEDVLLYFNAVLNRYAELQKTNPHEMKKEIESDPHWVNIQSRKKLRKIAEKAEMVGFLDHWSPGASIISTSETATTPLNL